MEKDSEIRARVRKWMRAELQRIAEYHGEDLSVTLREAAIEYIEATGALSTLGKRSPCQRGLRRSDKEKRTMRDVLACSYRQHCRLSFARDHPSHFCNISAHQALN
jgi:hypothetical protein